MTTDAAGAPDAANGLDLSAVTDGNYTFCIGQKMRANSDNNVYELTDAFQAADFPIGRVVHVHAPGDAKNRLEATLNAAGVAAGQGNAAYIFFAVTIDEVGNVYDAADWNRFTAEVPADVAVDQALLTGMAALLGRLAEALEAGGAVADLFRTAVQGINETVVLDGSFTMKASASGTYQVQDNGSGTGGLFVRLPSAGAEDDVADIDRVIHTTTWIELGTWRVVPSGNITKSHFLGSVIQYTFDYLVVDGAKPANEAQFKITLDGADVHRGELIRQVFYSWAVTIGGKGREGEGDLWMASDNDSTASWTSTAAKRAKAKAALNTGRLDKDIAGSGPLALTAEELGYDLIRLTGAKTGDRILSVPAGKPVGMLVFRNESTGAGHDAKIKAATQADGAAVTLPAGDSIIIAHGGSVARYG